METSITDTRRDLEARVGVDHIDELQAERRAIVAQLAPLRAQYGPGGTFDARRKAFRSAVANEIALRVTAERGKAPSEAELERLAAGDERVLRWMDAAETDMATYHLLENALAEKTELIRRDDALVRYATFEPKA